MLLWLALAAFLIPLIYVLTSSGDAKRSRNRKLDQIQRRLAEKEGRADGDDTANKETDPD